jgi:hypothetical protein
MLYCQEVLQEMDKPKCLFCILKRKEWSRFRIPFVSIFPSAQVFFREKALRTKCQLDFSRLNAYSVTGLPDSLFSYQKSHFGHFWRALEWKMLVYFRDCWNSLRPFLIFYGHSIQSTYGHLVYFFPFWMLGPRKIWQPCSQNQRIVG